MYIPVFFYYTYDVNVKEDYIFMISHHRKKECMYTRPRKPRKDEIQLQHHVQHKQQMKHYHYMIKITTALVLSTRDWGEAGSKAKLTECPLAFMKRA